MIPWIFGGESFQQMQLPLSIFAAVLCVFMGLFLLTLWVPSYNKLPTQTRYHIREAYGLFGMGALSLIFGLYFYIVVLILVIVLIGRIIWKSVQIMKDKQS